MARTPISWNIPPITMVNISYISDYEHCEILPSWSSWVCFVSSYVYAPPHTWFQLAGVAESEGLRSCSSGPTPNCSIDLSERKKVCHAMRWFRATAIVVMFRSKGNETRRWHSASSSQVPGLGACFSCSACARSRSTKPSLFTSRPALSNSF